MELENTPHIPYKDSLMVQHRTYLTLALEGDEWSASSPIPFTTRERAPGSHWIRGWVGSRAGLDSDGIHN